MDIDDVPATTPPAPYFCELDDVLEAVNIWSEEFADHLSRPQQYEQYHEHLCSGCELLAALIDPLHYKGVLLIDHLINIFVDTLFRGYQYSIHYDGLAKGLKRWRQNITPKPWTPHPALPPPPSHRSPLRYKAMTANWLPPLVAADQRIRQRRAKDKGKAREEPTEYHRADMSKEGMGMEKEERPSDQRKEKQGRTKKPKSVGENTTLAAPPKRKVRAATVEKPQPVSKRPSRACGEPRSRSAVSDADAGDGESEEEGAAPTKRKPVPAPLVRLATAHDDPDDVEEIDVHDPPCKSCRPDKPCKVNPASTTAGRKAQTCLPCYSSKKKCSLVQTASRAVVRVEVVRATSIAPRAMKPLEVARARPPVEPTTRQPRAPRQTRRKVPTPVAPGSSGELKGTSSACPPFSYLTVFIILVAGLPLDLEERLEAYEQRSNELQEKFYDLKQDFTRIDAENQALRNYIQTRFVQMWEQVQSHAERCSGSMQAVVNTVSNDPIRHKMFMEKLDDMALFLGVPPHPAPFQYPTPLFPAYSIPDIPPSSRISGPSTSRLEVPTTISAGVADTVPVQEETTGAAHGKGSPWGEDEVAVSAPLQGESSPEATLLPLGPPPIPGDSARPISATDTPVLRWVSTDEVVASPIVPPLTHPSSAAIIQPDPTPRTSESAPLVGQDPALNPVALSPDRNLGNAGGTSQGPRAGTDAPPRGFHTPRQITSPSQEDSVGEAPARTFTMPTVPTAQPPTPGAESAPSCSFNRGHSQSIPPPITLQMRSTKRTLMEGIAEEGEVPATKKQKTM